jgi:hypothetical protein
LRQELALKQALESASRQELALKQAPELASRQELALNLALPPLVPVLLRSEHLTLSVMGC